MVSFLAKVGRFFDLDGSEGISNFLSFQTEKRTMSVFQFNPEEQNLTI